MDLHLQVLTQTSKSENGGASFNCSSAFTPQVVQLKHGDGKPIEKLIYAPDIDAIQNHALYQLVITECVRFQLDLLATEPCREKHQQLESNLDDLSRFIKQVVQN